MKLHQFLIILLPVILGNCQESQEDLKLISLNIRYDNPADGINAWPERKAIVADFLKNENPGLIGFQEALWHQYTYLDSLLMGYGSVAAGRDDGKTGGEMTPIFYKKSLFKLVNSGTFWLSETPDLPGSRGWGAVLPRIVTWACLTGRDGRDTLYFFNTHFSHMSDSARVMSSAVLKRELAGIAGESNFIISGDFNMLPDSRAYRELALDPIADSFIESSLPPEGEIYTFNGFRSTPGNNRIDYIFVKKGIDIQRHTTRSVYRDSVFISDHWPVIVSLSF